MNLPESQIQLLMIVGGVVAIIVIFFLLRALGGGGRRDDMMQPPGTPRGMDAPPGWSAAPAAVAGWGTSQQNMPLGMRETLSDDAAYQAYWASYGVEKDIALRSLHQLAVALQVPLGYLRPSDRIADYAERGQKLLQGLHRMEALIEHFGGHVQIEKIEDLVKAFAQIGPMMMGMKHPGQSNP
jgi:hypothetical protein